MTLSEALIQFAKSLFNKNELALIKLLVLESLINMIQLVKQTSREISISY